MIPVAGFNDLVAKMSQWLQIVTLQK